MFGRVYAKFLAALPLACFSGASTNGGAWASCGDACSISIASPESFGHALLQRKTKTRLSAEKLRYPALIGGSSTPFALNAPNASALVESVGSLRLSSAYPKVLRSMSAKETLFYHVHIPKTGGSTVAELLVSDICAPMSDNISLHGYRDYCNITCEMGFTDNQLACFPNRNHFEHNAFSLNMQRAEELKSRIGARKIIYVTTLRRGSDRVVSHWAAELHYGSFRPPPGVPLWSMESLRHYFMGWRNYGSHDGRGWIAGSNPSLRNNLQVGQLSSWLTPDNNQIDKPLTRKHLEAAKQVLMQGDWIIGFTTCMPQMQKRLSERAKALHMRFKEKAAPRPPSATSHVVIDPETQAQLDRHSWLDNALYKWVWDLATKFPGRRFTDTC
jgi:hypothetical protein